MRNKAILLGTLVLSSIGFFVAVLNYDNPYLLKSFYSFLSVAILYFVFKFVLDEGFSRRIKEAATQYSFRRTLSIFFYITLVLVLIAIWVDVQNLLVAYGIVGAGIAIALQDFFKNAAGGLLIFIRGNYKVGDRIEINSRKGDVIDIDLLNTTLLEIGEWVSGDQPTGRLSLIPNGLILSNTVHNYTKDHQYLWDEITIPITYQSDWRYASDLILGLVKRETEDVTIKAKDSVSKLSKRYYLPQRAEVPYIFNTLTDNWIEFTIRYVAEVRQRRLVKDRLSRIILTEIEKVGPDKIKIASTTLNVTLDNIDKSPQS